nr:MAG TPA: hypothetical protein [Caudoviricetes sp.]
MTSYKIHGVKVFRMYDINIEIECDTVEYIGNDSVILWKGGEKIDTLHNVYYFELHCIDDNTYGFFTDYLELKIREGVRTSNTDIKKIRNVYIIKDNVGSLYLAITNADLDIVHFFGGYEISGTILEALNALREDIDMCLYFDNDVTQLHGTNLDYFLGDDNFDVRSMFTRISEYEN